MGTEKDLKMIKLNAAHREELMKKEKLAIKNVKLAVKKLKDTKKTHKAAQKTGNKETIDKTMSMVNLAMEKVEEAKQIAKKAHSDVMNASKVHTLISNHK